MPDMGPIEGGIGTPDELRAHLRKFADVGVDQVIFIQQGGRNRHDHICESLELFAGEVMPEFKEREAERERAKAERLAPAIEAAMERKQFMRGADRRGDPGASRLRPRHLRVAGAGLGIADSARESRG